MRPSPTHIIPPLGERDCRIDYLKGILILLMIAFHLAYFADAYPMAKQFVYTFHMPGFLVISGYLMNLNKPVRLVWKSLMWLVVPYLVMESGYVLMASVVPTRDHIDQLTLPLFLNKLLIHPLGPYWYLQTIILCGSAYHLLFRFGRLPATARLLLLALAYCALAATGIVSLGNALYFLAGTALRCSGLRFGQVFRTSWWPLLALPLLAMHPHIFNRANAGGAIVLYLVVCLLLAAYPLLPAKAAQVLQTFGRNSLTLYIFSPIFTLCCKIFIPWLQFDPTRLLFLAVSLPLCVLGCMATGKLLDVLHITPWLLGRKKAMA